jgi:hypothetical protein
LIFLGISKKLSKQVVDLLFYCIYKSNQGKKAKGNQVKSIIEIHPSSLTEYADCPRRAAAKMLKKEIIQAGYDLREPNRVIGASVGTAVHTGAQYTLDYKIDTGSLAPLKETQDKAMDMLQTGIAEGIVWDDTSPNRNTAEKQTLRMVGEYMQNIAPVIQPIRVEYKMSYPIAEGYRIVGTIDLLASHPSALRDLKTGAKMKMHLPQIGGYHYMLRKHGHPVEILAVDYVPRISINKSQPPAQYHEYDAALAEQAAAATIRRFMSDHKEFEKRQAAGQPIEFAFLANPSSMLCSKKYCPAHGTQFCREHMPTKE